MKSYLYAFWDAGVEAYSGILQKDQAPKDFCEAIRRQLVKNPNDAIASYSTVLLGEFDDMTGDLTVCKQVICDNWKFVKKPEPEEKQNG